MSLVISTILCQHGCSERSILKNFILGNLVTLEVICGDVLKVDSFGRNGVKYL